MLIVKEQQYSDISSRRNQSLCFPLHVTKDLKTFTTNILFPVHRQAEIQGRICVTITDLLLCITLQKHTSIY